MLKQKFHRRRRRERTLSTALRHHSRRALLVLGGLLIALGAGAATPEGRLFHIERSTNANIVAYDVHLNPRGTIDTGDPIDAYWIRLAEDGRRKDLSSIEKRLAYGYKAKPHGEDGLKLILTALPEREMTVTRGRAGYEARLPLKGVQSRLVKVFVKTDERGMWPKVLYIDLFGERLDNGEPIRERQMND